jgi:two-component system LytT family response regulator
MIRTLIVDDEPLARKRLRSLLRPEPDIEVIGEASSGREAAELILRDRPDLVFLDIKMPGTGGFSVIEKVGVEHMPHVVFVTAFDDFAVKAFEVRALDYVLKPYDKDRLEEAVGRVRRRLRNAGADEEYRKRMRDLSSKTASGSVPLDRILVKAKGRMIVLKTADIEWIEASGNYVVLHCGAESHLLRESMDKVAGRLDGRVFTRIHRSSIVNIDRIAEIQPAFHGEYNVFLKSGAKLLLSRTYSGPFKALFSGRKPASSG